MQSFNAELWHGIKVFESCVLLVLQGSYGVVKLAYNEDDDKYYVSQFVSF